MKSKIASLDVEATQAVLAVVEATLAASARPSKRVIVEALSVQGLCSPKSSGSEETFLKQVSCCGIPLTPKFAEVMQLPAGTQVAAAAKIQLETAPVPLEQLGTTRRLSPPLPLEIPGVSSVSMVALKGASRIDFYQDNGSRITFPDGGSLLAHNFDEQKLRSSCNLIEFSASSK